MYKHTKIYHFSTVVLFFFAIYCSYSQESIPQKIKTGCLRSASVSFLAVNLTTGDTISSFEPYTSLVPASTLKLITTATGLEIFSPNHRFTTYLAMQGKVNSTGILNGNIFFIGGGDPALGSDRFPNIYINPGFITQFVGSIKKAGIKQINGQILFDNAYFSSNDVPDTWSWEDIGNYYGAAAHSLSFSENTYRIHFSSGHHHGDPTLIKKVTPDVDGMTFTNQVYSSKVNKDLAYIFGCPLCKNRLIRGSIPKNRHNFVVKGSIPDPEYLLIKTFQEELKKQSITITNKSRNTINEKYNIIDSVQSPTLEKLMYETNMESVNLYAEHFLKHIGLRIDNTGSTEGGCNSITNFWQKRGMAINGFFIEDGCGLSRFNAISASHLVYILTSMYRESKHFDIFFHSLPVMGETGTLKYSGLNSKLKSRVHAKTGSMRRVRSMAGYLLNSRKEKIAFTLIINNYSCSGKEMKYLMTELLESLY